MKVCNERNKDILNAKDFYLKSLLSITTYFEEANCLVHFQLILIFVIEDKTMTFDEEN